MTRLQEQADTQEVEVAAFVEDLNQALAARDVDWLTPRLHPQHFLAWTEDECRTALGGWDPPAGVWEVSAIESLGNSTLDYGAVGFVSFGNGYRVTYDDGVSDELKTLTVSLDPGGPYWFAICG